MKTFISDGGVVPIVAPTGGTTAGAGVLVGSIFGVANDTVTAGSTVGLAMFGVFTLAKATGQAWTVGVTVYWDNTNKNLTTTSAGNTKVGYARDAAASADTTGVAILTLGGA
jgi:predicted RecA/RadA family phage recombinase